MMGTFGGALDARQIDASNDKLTADVRGEVELEEGVLVIRRIHVAMRLIAPEEKRATDRARSRNLRNELPVVPNLAQRDSAHVVLRVSRALKGASEVD